MTKEELLEKRDKKAHSHLIQYAPVWIVDEKITEADESVQFNVVFHHNKYGWVSRRYRYDAFNNVLYHKGQTTLTESDSIDIQYSEPYIDTIVANTPNAYGG